MPRLDGFAAAAEIRRRAGRQAPVIIAVTANVSPEVHAACLACGFGAVLLEADLSRRPGRDPAELRAAFGSRHDDAHDPPFPGPEEPEQEAVVPRAEGAVEWRAASDPARDRPQAVAVVLAQLLSRLDVALSDDVVVAEPRPVVEADVGVPRGGVVHELHAVGVPEEEVGRLVHVARGQAPATASDGSSRASAVGLQTCIGVVELPDLGAGRNWLRREHSATVYALRLTSTFTFQPKFVSCGLTLFTYLQPGAATSRTYWRSRVLPCPRPPYHSVYHTHSTSR